MKDFICLLHEKIISKLNINQNFKKCYDKGRSSVNSITKNILGLKIKMQNKLQD